MRLASGDLQKFVWIIENVTWKDALAAEDFLTGRKRAEERSGMARLRLLAQFIQGGPCDVEFEAGGPRSCLPEVRKVCGAKDEADCSACLSLD
jgi:hypothetical protein